MFAIPSSPVSARGGRWGWRPLSYERSSWPFWCLR